MKMGAVAIVVASLLAACGGGGTSPSPPASPVFSSGGDVVLGYAQTATASGAAGLVFPGFTCLSPQTVRSETSNATISQSFATGTFDGRSGLIAVTSSVALQSCADGTEPVNETDYFAQVSQADSNTTALALVGSVIDYASYFGVARTVTVRYGSPGLIVNELPMQSGRIWTSTAARTVTSSAGSGYRETVTVNADGSYSDELLELNGIFPYESVTTNEKTDGSGSQTEVAGANASAPPYGLSLSAPVANTVIVTPSGVPPVPPSAPTPVPCPTNGGTPCPVVTPTPYAQYAWYPYVPSSAKPLETIATMDKGSTTLPASCAVSRALPLSAELIETVDATLDVWSGTSTATSDAYVDPHDGLLCLNVSVQPELYAFAGTNADSTPVATTTLTFSDALQSETAPPPVLAATALARYLTLWR